MTVVTRPPVDTEKLADPDSFPPSRNDLVKSNASNLFMISSADFTVVPPGGGRRISTANRTPGGASTAGRGAADELVSGRSHDRQRATSATATGQLHDRLRAVPVPPSTIEQAQGAREQLSYGGPRQEQ